MGKISRLRVPLGGTHRDPAVSAGTGAFARYQNRGDRHLPRLLFHAEEPRLLHVAGRALAGAF